YLIYFSTRRSSDLDKYPVFLDHTNKILSHYVKHINVFFSRLTDDIDEITADLLDGLHLQIVDIKSNLGDPHNDCQSTIGIVFEDNYEVYYKVRSSSGERYLDRKSTRLNSSH